jgi:hypothetical protein
MTDAFGHRQPAANRAPRINGDVCCTAVMQPGPGAKKGASHSQLAHAIPASSHVRRIGMYHDADIVYHWLGEPATILFSLPRFSEDG